MRFFAASILIALATITACGQDPTQTPTPSQKPAVRPEVDLELKQTASAYRTGDFEAAQLHAERAVSLDPASVTAATFLARVLHQRYQPGNDTPENLDRARAAIAAYQRLLTLEPQHEEAYKAIAVLYASTHQDELLRQWVLQRASNPLISNEKRADAYAVLAGKYWDCSYKITELPNHKVTESTKQGQVITYKRPDDLVEFERAKQCVANGLGMADAALLLVQNSEAAEAAWSYKTNLLLEGAKLAEMEGMDLLKANYQREAKEAQTQAGKISEELRKKEEQDPQGPHGLEILPRPLPPPPPPLKP